MSLRPARVLHAEGRRLYSTINNKCEPLAERIRCC